MARGSCFRSWYVHSVVLINGSLLPEDNEVSEGRRVTLSFTLDQGHLLSRRKNTSD